MFLQQLGDLLYYYLHLKRFRGERPEWAALMKAQPDVQKSIEERVEMTACGRDCDAIPKVEDAGELRVIDGTSYQVMHNGLLVEAGGYGQDWTVEIIRRLRGHHEPQEEKVFHEVLKRLPEDSVMMELGSSWAYYSMWFASRTPGGRSFCCEPEALSLAQGHRNAKINGLDNMEFRRAAAGKDDGRLVDFFTGLAGEVPSKVEIRSVDSLVKELALDRVDVLHMDIQGQELLALDGASRSITSGLVRFLFVSTHHHYISDDPDIHSKCLEKIWGWGGHVITELAVHEGRGGDGLIVASFHPEDRDFSVSVERIRMSESLFRSLNADLDTLRVQYEDLRAACDVQPPTATWVRLLQKIWRLVNRARRV